MAIGEKLQEGKAKSIGVEVSSVSSEGVMLKGTTQAMLKGMGKANGVDGQLTFTSMIQMGPNGEGWSQGQGMFNTTVGEMAVLKNSDFMTREGGKGKSVVVMSFMSKGTKLSWLNGQAVLVTQEGDAAWNEWDIVIWEWN